MEPLEQRSLLSAADLLQTAAYDDVYEDNDSPGIVDARPAGQQGSPNLGPIESLVLLEDLVMGSDGEDWYRFETLHWSDSGHGATILFYHDQGDLDLELVAADGVTVLDRSESADDDETVSLDALGPGTYYLCVYGYDGATNPNYTLGIIPGSADDEYEDNDLPEIVDLQPVGEVGSSNLGPIDSFVLIDNLMMGTDAEDWYRFETLYPSDSGHGATILFSHNQGDLDLELLAADGATVLDRSESMTDDEAVSFDGLEPGTYYLRVYSFPGITNPNYTLGIIPGSHDDAYEDNDSLDVVDAQPAGAADSPHLGTVSDAITMDGLVLGTDGVDYYRFELAETASSGAFVRIEFSHALGDLDLTLLDLSGAVIGSADSTSDDEEIGLEGLPAGAYYAAVEGFDGAENDYRLVIDVASSPEPPIAEPLGTIEFLELADLDPSSGDLWYRAETTRPGLLTLEASSRDGAEGVELVLLDGAGSPLAASAGVGPYARIDWPVEAGGQTYYIGLGGSSGQADLVLANLVGRLDDTVIIHGTETDDQFEFAAASRRVAVNGLEYDLGDAGGAVVKFHAGAGNDTALLRGSGADEIARLWPRFGKLQTGPSVVLVTDVESIFARSGGGNDVVKLYDDPLTRDVFVGTPDYAKFSGTDFVNRASDFRYVYAYASASDDVARLYDDWSTQDVLVATPDYAKFYGVDFFTRAVDFRYVHAYASGNGDIAKLYDASESKDFFVGLPDYAKLYGADFFNRAVDFRYVHAYASTGDDVARLYDAPEGNDVFLGTPDFAKLHGPGFFTRAVGFRHVHAYASGATDVAKLYDSEAEDTLVAKPTYSRLFGEQFDLRVVDFRYVRAYSTRGGSDQAYLFDSVLDDYLRAGADWARLFNNDPDLGFSVWIGDFEYAKAWSTDGEDRKELDPAALAWLVLEGPFFSA